MEDLPVKRPRAELARPFDDTETVRSVLRSVTRRGPWEPPETMELVSVLGNIVLDYRDTELPLGVTTVDCQVYLGNIEIIVPPDVDVELTGSVVLGAVETKGGAGRLDWRRGVRRLLGREREIDADFERPLLSIECSGALGNVEVKLA